MHLDFEALRALSRSTAQHDMLDDLAWSGSPAGPLAAVADDQTAADPQRLRRASDLQREILAGIRAGEDYFSLFLKALDCISLLSGNPLYYSEALADLKAINPALFSAIPLHWILEETQERIEAMELTAQGPMTEDQRERTLEAIQAHRERERALLELVGGIPEK